MYYHNLKTNISGIIPNQNYNFFVEGLNSDWPVKAFPPSGTISSLSNNFTINTSIYFCEDIDNCNNYLVYNSGTHQQGSDPFANIRLKITSDVLNNPIYTDPVNIVCSGCAEVPTISVPNSWFELKGTNQSTINVNFSGLKPYTTYTYQFQDIGTNYPIDLQLVSGTFTTQQNKTYSLRTDFAFCGYEDCDNAVIGSGFLNKIGTEQCDKYYTNLELVLNSSYLDGSIKSPKITVECDSCLPKPFITLPENFELDATTTNAFNLITSITGLKPNSKYDYSFEHVGGNHSVVLDSVSGYFYTDAAGTDVDVITLITVCESSGLCGNSNVLGSIQSTNCGKIKNTKLRVKLDSDCLDYSIYSSPVNVTCDNCLPIPNIGVPSSKVTLSTVGDEPNIYNLTSSISNLKPYSSYDYEIVDLKTNHLIGFDNLSGTFSTLNETTHSLLNSIVFCESSGYCNNYVTSGTMNSNRFSNTLNTSFRIKLSSTCLASPVYSDPVTIDCEYCLPYIDMDIPNEVTLTSTSGNIYAFNVPLSPLKLYSTYNYTIKNVNTNHLVGFKNLSGTFNTENNQVVTISNQLVFCESSGYCNTYAATGSPNSNVCNNLLTTSFVVELDNDDLYSSIVSKPIVVNCNNCIPKLSVSLPVGSNLTTTNMVSLTGTVSGLKPLQSYDYYFTGDNNWPILLDNISGSFVPKTSSQNIVTKVLFCYPSGDCAGENGLLPHTLSSSAQKTLNNNTLYGKLKLNVKSSSCDSSLYSSEISNITCKDCLPCVRYADVQISGSPVITLPDNCCNGQKLLSVNVTNAIPSEKYTYSFGSVSGVGVNKLEFNPRTGEMYFGSGGAGTINSICAIDLVDFTQTLINFELTHSNTNFKVYDSIGLVCSTGSC